jgi:hypothetical protein
MQSAEDTLRSYLLPHVGGTESESDKKIFFIGYMVSNNKRERCDLNALFLIVIKCLNFAVVGVF